MYYHWEYLQSKAIQRSNDTIIYISDDYDDQVILIDGANHNNLVYFDFNWENYIFYQSTLFDWNMSFGVYPFANVMLRAGYVKPMVAGDLIDYDICIFNTFVQSPLKVRRLWLIWVWQLFYWYLIQSKVLMSTSC